MLNENYQFELSFFWGSLSIYELVCFVLSFRRLFPLFTKLRSGISLKSEGGPARLLTVCNTMMNKLSITVPI